jgi:hypothetical protein
MKSRFGKWLPATLALAGLVVAGASRDARAQTLVLRSTIDGTPATYSSDQNATPPSASNSSAWAGATIVPDNNPTAGQLGNGTTSTPIIIPVTGGNLEVFGSLSTTTSPGSGGSQSPPEITSSSLHVENLSSSTHTIVLQISDVGFTSPPSPVTFSATASGSFDPINGNSSVAGASAVAQAYADTTYFGNSFTTQNFSSGTAPANSPIFSYNNSATAGGFTYSGSYSMTVQLTFVLPPNTELTGRSNVELAQISGVPEPASVVMFSSALPLVGLGWWVRRRRIS